MKKQAVWTYILEACFVCPSVFDDMQLKTARGFCDAYVMTREGGHHAQTLPGYSWHINGLSGKVSQAEYNEQVKRLELQHLKALHMEQVNNVCAGSKRDITMVHYRAGIL